MTEINQDQAWKFDPANDAEHYTLDIVHGFLLRIDEMTDALGLSEDETEARLAEKTGRTVTAIRRTLQKPHQASLLHLVQIARALDLHVALVPYSPSSTSSSDDRVTQPVSAPIFERCWNAMGRPTDGSQISSDARTSGSTPAVVEALTLEDVQKAVPTPPGYSWSASSTIILPDGRRIVQVLALMYGSQAIRETFQTSPEYLLAWAKSAITQPFPAAIGGVEWDVQRVGM